MSTNNVSGTGPPYDVVKCEIASFGDLVDVKADGNCFFRALWESNQQNVASKNNVDMNDIRFKIHKFASRNWPRMVSNVHNSCGKSHYGTMRRKTFDSNDFKLKLLGNEEACKRCDLFFNWYKEKILRPIYNDSQNYTEGTFREYWGNATYHGPILALKWKKSICFYLHVKDQEEKVRYEVFVCLYDKELDSINTWLHTGYIAPPDKDCLLIWFNGINHFNWIRRHDILETVLKSNNSKATNDNVSPKGLKLPCKSSMPSTKWSNDLKKPDLDKTDKTDMFDPAIRNMKKPPNMDSKEFIHQLNQGRYLNERDSYPVVIKKKVGRSFSKKMLNSYDWLEWSPTSNKMYCFCCYMMQSDLIGWTTKGNNNYTNKTTVLKKHSNNTMHQDAYLACNRVQSTQSIITNSLLGKKVVAQKNVIKGDQREYTKKLMDCVAYCQVGGIALRGHDETESSENPGNFRRAVKLLAKHVPEFKEQLKKRKNTKKEWLSPLMQRDLAKAIIQVVLELIIIEVGNDKIYAILADECTDVTGSELMTVVIRYVSSTSGKISERTIGTVKVDDTTSNELFNTVVKVLARVKLQVSESRAQGYDGASNMSGHLTGLAARVKEISPLAIYAHCCNHKLNLVVQKIGLDVPDYQSVLGIMRLVYNIISPSNKRLLWFKKHQSEIERVGKQQLSIKGLSDTRWVYHYRCAHALKECFGSVVYTLNMVIEDKTSKPEQKSACQGILLQLEDWKFIFWITALMEILAGINLLNNVLQTKNDTLWEALREVDTCRTTIKKMRTNEGFIKVWNDAKLLADKNNIITPNLSHNSDAKTGKRKRVPKKFTDFVPTGPDGVSMSHNQDCTVKTLFSRRFFEVVDNLIADFNVRFNDEYRGIVNASKCLHPYDSFESFEVKDLNFLYNHFEVDFPGHNDNKLLLNEHVHYTTKLKSEIKKEKLEKMTFADITVWVHEQTIFPLLSRLLKLTIVLPSTTATCERNFSALKFIKNNLRNQLGYDFLDDLMLGFLEKDLVNKIINTEELRERVIDVFRDLGCGTPENKTSRKHYL